MTARFYGLFLAALTWPVGCAPQMSQVVGAPPRTLLGRFADDYDNEYEISATLWRQEPHGEYRIIKWDVPGQYAIAQNTTTNSSDSGLWARIDWMPLEMAPYTWAYCYSAYEAPSAAAAETVSVARRESPRTGCNGFPFSRMRPLAVGEPK
jgi:hypothetical protein